MEKYLDLKNDKDYTKIKEASKIINNGGLVLFPTETVYGIGADGLNEQAVKNIFIAKGRKQDNPLISPKHYAPNSKCMLIYSKENGKMVDYINETTKKYKNPLIVCHTKNLKSYNSNNIIDMGETLEEVTKNIFKILRKVDSYNPDIVLIEGVQKDGLGLAIMNRLIRACEHNYIEL